MCAITKNPIQIAVEELVARTGLAGSGWEEKFQTIIVDAVQKSIAADRNARLTDTPQPNSAPTHDGGLNSTGEDKTKLTPEAKAAFLAKIKASKKARAKPPADAVKDWEILSKKMPAVVAIQIIEALSELVFHVLDGHLTRVDIPPTTVELNLLCARTAALSMLEQALTGLNHRN